MATATITITLPTTRTDGTPFDATTYGGAHVFRDGTQLGTVTAPALSFVDAGLAPGTYVYSASVFDTQVPPAESAQASAAPVTVPTVLAAPSAPTLAVVLS